MIEDYGGQNILKKAYGLFISIVFIAMIFLPVTSSAPINNSHPVPAAAPPQKEIMVNSTQTIENIIQRIDENLMAKYIQGLQDFKTRFSYRGDKCYAAADYIAQVFDRNYLNVSYDDFVYKNFNMRNIIGEKPGTQTPNETVIICSHYDSITGFAWADAPGADDNGSGTAAVMAAAEILSDYEFNYTIRFIAFSGEEQYLKGSQNYVNGLISRGENIRGVINLDMIAYNPEPSSNYIGLFVESWSPLASQYSVATHNLANFTNQTALKYGHITNIETYGDVSGSSDHGAFNPEYPAIMLLEYNFNSPNYHSTSDTIDKLNMTYCANVTQIAIATIAELAELNSSDISPPAHSPGFPPNGGFGQATPIISIDVTDASYLDLFSIEMCVNGAVVSHDLNVIPMGYNISYSPAIPYSDGQTVNVSVYAADVHGSNFNYSWEFQIDAIPPEPPTNLTIESTRIEFEKQGLAIDVGPGTYDIKHALSPSVIFQDGEYKMWYGGYDNAHYQICYANSSDGISWVKHGVVIPNGISGDDDFAYASYPSVLYDNEYKVWYSGYDGAHWRILYANSSDGINWVKHGLCIDISGPEGYDSQHATFANVVKNGEYKMWYCGLDGLKYNILYANSSDGINWIKHTRPIKLKESSQAYGDAFVTYPEVLFHNGEYKLWYNRYDGKYMRTMYANSSDGFEWTDHGLAIDVGYSSEDTQRANKCSVLIINNETKVWYTAYNNVNWRIMYANLTPEMEKTDLKVSWTPSISDDIVRYEVYRESRPSAFPPILETACPEYYNVPDYITPWSARSESIINASVYGPVTGSHPPFFQFPDDNIIDITIYMKFSTGAWQKLVRDVEFFIESDSGTVYLDPLYPFTPGTTFHAFYNHTATKGMKIMGDTIVDVGAGSSNQSYYYKIMAVDKAGYRTEATALVGIISIPTAPGWTLVSSPFISGPISLSDALNSLDWTAARTWDPDKLPNHWTLNRTTLSDSLSTLEYVDSDDGIWVESAEDNFTTCGIVSNITISLKAGWNLISYPYHEIISVSQAFAGLPWDAAEEYDYYEPNYLVAMDGNSPLLPGRGYWVHLTADAEWNAINA